MSDLIKPIYNVRDSVCAILRIVTKHQSPGKKKPHTTQYELLFVGTAWCIVKDKYLLTAYHIFNDGKPRDPSNKFIAFIVPNNGPQAFHYPIVGFPIEDVNTDTAILELGNPVNHSHSLPSVPITFNRLSDGAKVFTVGFPSPMILGANVDPQGNYKGGNFFLKSHINEGIVAAQFEMNNLWLYEFNIGWFNGESGGPIFQIDPPAGFALMQRYRGIQTKHGIVPGPHSGFSLENIKTQLISFGATII